MKKIVLANPTTTGLIDNLLPIWVGREMEEKETLEILEECEGENNKGRVIMDANKRTIILNTNIHLQIPKTQWCTEQWKNDSEDDEPCTKGSKKYQ